ncbi:uncharacterized protein Tco025E_04844 [Trypanosoma conorhini]|uniref:Uncharacterized protein n=1 Tax=Trypanosoma conorhini TaxID=83891 RepID=A0A3S5ITC5_9TRYP|nr:uncharacterized protein Tco025E_04844 [Trypanosoma conorhini]RNF17427.1 hypothetical protein Tco025E_04844 [Trypanosoma conorhini]
MSMKAKHSLTVGSTLGHFAGIVDCELHRVNIVYLVRGYHMGYSLAVATYLLLVALTFLLPTERPVYVGVLPFIARCVTVLMVAGGLFRTTGGVFTRRKHQEEWFLGNAKDFLYFLLDNASFSKLGYTLLVLEVMAQLGNVLRGSACVCVVLLLWLAWLLLRMKRGVVGDVS